MLLIYITINIPLLYYVLLCLEYCLRSLKKSLKRSDIGYNVVVLRDVLVMLTSISPDLTRKRKV